MNPVELYQRARQNRIQNELQAQSQVAQQQAQEQQLQLHRQAQAQQAYDALQRNQLGIQALAERQQIAQAQNQARQAVALAALKSHSDTARALQDYRDRQATEANRHNLASEKIAQDRLTKPVNPKSIHEPGVGIWDWNADTGQWEQSVTFPERKNNRGTGPRLTVNKDGTKSISGDPKDPDVIAFQKELDSQKAAEDAAPAGSPGIFDRITGGVANSIFGNALANSAQRAFTPSPSGIPVPPKAFPEPQIPSFDSEEEAQKSGVKGIVTIKGRKARID